jgi:pimeloyl-ACP methyl ester carboxylesterase
MRSPVVALKAFAGGRLFGERIGSGPPAVLGLHGWRRDRSDLAVVLAGTDAVVLDLPGFGASPPPAEAWGAREYAEALLPVFDEFPGPAVVLGHSFGGRAAVCLAAAHPELVRALVLTGVPLLRTATSRRAPIAYRALRWMHKRGVASEERMERARQRYGSPDYRAAAGVMRNVLVRTVNESYERELALIRCPVELVWGEADAEASVEMARRAASMVPDARLTVLPGKDHFTALADPALRKAVDDHLP